MEPLPLIPRIQNTVTPEMGCLVREVFQNAFQSETATWKISINLSKSCRDNPDLRLIGSEIQTEIIDHKGTLDDLEYAEIKIMQSRGYSLCRDQRITSNEKAMEVIRLKRHPLYIDLHPNIIEKYPLLQSDDLLPPAHVCDTDFRLNEKDRIRMKKRLYRSRDSLLDEVTLPKAMSRVCRFDATTEQRSRKMRIRERSSNLRMATQRQSIIRTEYAKTILIAEPEELFFHNFEYNKVYKKNVLIKNVSNSMARYKIERRLPESKFRIIFDTAAMETTKIAPGMHIKLTVLFSCNVIEDPQEFLIVNVQCGRTVCVKMCGYRDPPILKALNPPYPIFSVSDQANTGNSSLSLPSIFEEEGEQETRKELQQQLTETHNDRKEYSKVEVNVKCNMNLGANFECGECFVGERIVVPIKFVNNGGDGRFFIISEIDWATMNIDDIMDCNMILIPPFAMWPIYFTLRSSQCIEIRTYFYPESYGTQVDKLYILCDNHSIHPIELIGDGVLYDPNFVRFGDTLEKIRSPVNEDQSFVDYILNIGDIEPGESVENSILVSNTSGLELYYRWEKHSTKYFTLTPKSGCADLPIENIDVEPGNGFLNSKSVTSFKIVTQIAKDLQPSEHRAILRLYIEDIPLAAIPKDCDSAITESLAKRRRNCPITVDILVADIELLVNCILEKVPLRSSCEKTDNERETRWFDEADKRNCSLDDSNSSSNSTTAIEILSSDSSMAIDNPSICGTGNLQCNKHYKGIKNCGNLWTASIEIRENLDSDTSAIAVPKIEFNYRTTNTAILIPDRPLYLGIEQTYTLTLRNLICKPSSYAWGEPLEKNDCKMKVNLNPEKGLIPPTDAITIEVICLPLETGIVDNFFIPCFIGNENSIILGIECIIDALYVTFLFPPASNAILFPCVDSVRVEWRKDGHKSTLNLNNLEMNENSDIHEELELKNIDLDAGQVVATTAVGPAIQETENVSLVRLPESPSSGKQEFKKLKVIGGRNKSPKKFKLKDSTATVESESEFEKPELQSELRSWENLLNGIVWTSDKPDEFILLNKPQATVPFYKTIVPPITQALAIEFVDLPLRTVAKRTFVIRNETPAESKFLITLKHFGPINEIDRDLDPKNTIDVTYANVMGHKSDNNWEELKPPGQGIVLLIEPTTGNLAPHETVPIDIHVYGDTWGIYIDEITVAIVGLPDYIFGVCTQVVGSPITYPVCKNGLNEIPVLRFGSLRLGTESVTRKITIENTSSIALIINWYSFLINQHPETENLHPFNIILQMFSPLTNKIADTTRIAGSGNAQNDKKISTIDSRIVTSEQIIPNPNKCDSVIRSLTENPPIIEMDSLISNYYQIETGNQSLLCSESLLSSEKILSQDKERELGNSFGRDHSDDDYSEYTDESEIISSRSLSEQTLDKETELEFSLTPYYGVPDYSVFTVSPSEMMIPGNEKRSIEITFNIENDKLKMENCKNEIVGRLMGFIRVAPMHKYKADCYSRNDGTMLTPTEIHLEAIIIQPILSHEITESDRTFKIYSSSVITRFGKHTEILRKYFFRNNEGEESMFVNAKSCEPFKVINLSTMKSKINSSESDGIFIPPGQYVEVEVLCSVDASWIDKAMGMGGTLDAEDSHTDITKNLLIIHVGSCNQVFPLSLRIHLPLLKFSTHKIEFGIINIGESKRINLTIENISTEKQILNIKSQKNNKDFTIHPNQSILLNEDRRAIDIEVTFAASKLDKSIEILEISTAVPDYIEECIIEGYGSWDIDNDFDFTGE